jgi:hypothetical protein
MRKNAHSCALSQTSLWALNVRQNHRVEEDGVIVAEFGESLLGQPFTTRVKWIRLGIGAGYLD